MKSTGRQVLCTGLLLTGLLSWHSGPAVAAETDTVGAASQGGSAPLVEPITYPAPPGLAQYNWQGHGWNIRSELTGRDLDRSPCS